MPCGKALIKAEHVNVQVHRGNSTNLAVSVSVLEVHASVLAMNLPHGGHLPTRTGLPSPAALQIQSLQRGSPSRMIDHDRLAQQVPPRMMVGGVDSYPRMIDCPMCGPSPMRSARWSFAHIAGLTAARVVPSPVPHSVIAASVANKTLRGMREVDNAW